ncbi:MAG: metal-dependent hydrolase [Alphaproteobacteria bacterium]|nr:metal-dependent hydrolase [Alphaproteobacteria bacterium]
MDPITQGVMGAALPQAATTSQRGSVALAGCFGFLAGLAADLDVFIRSAEDPLLFLEYHRQFTHSLLFIPLGGLISATILQVLIGKRLRLSFSRTLLFCTLGYGTHGLLDFATSYGTMLFWPFSHERYAANIISIVDPFLTVPVALLVVVSGLRRSPLFARIALAWVCVYLTLATIQHNAAMQMARELASARGHTIERVTVKPTFGNIFVWKSVYESKGRFYLDGLRVGVAPIIYPGTSIARLDPSRDFPWISSTSQQFRDLVRFDKLSQGFVARDPNDPNAVIDVRYSFLPNTVAALWSIVLAAGAAPDEHASYQTNRRSARLKLAMLWRLIVAEQN